MLLNDEILMDLTGYLLSREQISQPHTMCLWQSYACCGQNQCKSFKFLTQSLRSKGNDKDLDKEIMK